MIKVIGKMDVAMVQEPPTPKRFAPKSKSRKNCLNIRMITSYGELTYQECQQLCKELNDKKDGNFYFPAELK